MQSREKGMSVQMAARELRYQWFEEISENHNYKYIATAHHLDDQAETILINLIRGTGIAGLHGILPKNGRIIRPLMFATREQIESYAILNAIPFRRDSSNEEVKYQRNKIRHQLLPVILEINPGFSEKLQGTIRRIRETESAALAHIEKWKRENLIVHTGKIIFNAKALMESGFPALLLFSVASPFGFTESQIYDLLEGLPDSRIKRFFSASHQLVKNRNTIVISLKTSDNSENELVIHDFDSDFQLSDPIRLKFRKLLCSDDFRISADPCRASLDLDHLTFPLVVRKWQRGDEFQPLGLNGRKKISDFFTDQKFSQEDKENCRLLCCGPEIVWVIGHRIDHRFRITSDTSRILDIIFG
jgi:tRNA(Ile)-lysidine synthase